MLSALLLSSFLAGVAGSPHCLAMCGGLSSSALHGCAGTMYRKLWQFHVGRLMGYGMLGALAGGSFKLLGDLASQGNSLRPIWTLLHAATLLLGLYLLWRGEQPPQLNDLAHQTWRRIQPRPPAVQTLVFQPAGNVSPSSDRHRPAWLIGLTWALLPCSLLYSAAMLAAVSSNPWSATAIMLAFGSGSALALTLGQTLLGKFMQGNRGGWAVRLSGLLLLALSLNALVGMVLGYGMHGWCSTL